VKLTLNWLKEFVDIDVDTPKLVEMLDLSGTKVESVNRPGEGLSGVIVAAAVRSSGSVDVWAANPPRTKSRHAARCLNDSSKAIRGFSVSP